MAKRNQVPEWAKEGDILEKARRERKAIDGRYTQKYVASLVDKDQNYWTQWRSGTTRILDEYWLVFARELGFDPFETRPDLLNKHRLISSLLENAPTPSVAESDARYSGADIFRQLSEQEALQLIKEFLPELSPQDRIEIAQIALAGLSK